MKGVLLGDRDDPRTRIILPPGVEDASAPLVGKCLVVVDGATGQLCNATFYAGQEQEWQAHVAGCARSHLDEARRAAPSSSRKGTIYDRNEWDPEVENYMTGVVAPRMAAEGRLEVLPHERAGHS